MSAFGIQLLDGRARIAVHRELASAPACRHRVRATLMMSGPARATPYFAPTAWRSSIEVQARRTGSNRRAEREGSEVARRAALSQAVVGRPGEPVAGLHARTLVAIAATIASDSNLPTVHRVRRAIVFLVCPIVNVDAVVPDNV
jgi:hypothetical protein